MMIVAALLLQTSAAAAPQVSHEQIGEGHYRLRMIAPGISRVEEAQALLAPTAGRLCGSLPAHFGHFEWVSNEEVVNSSGRRTSQDLLLILDVFCGTPPPAPTETAAAPDPNWRQSEAQEQAVLARTRAYFEARDSGRYAEAYAMLTPAMQADSTLESWSRQASEYARRARASRGRQPTRVTWYNDPPSAPVHGLYAAVDYNGNFADLLFMCGYVVWLLQADGSWRLASEAQSAAARADAPNATAAEIAQMRAQASCRD
jgi:hypothetical protein